MTVHGFYGGLPVLRRAASVPAPARPRAVHKRAAQARGYLAVQAQVDRGRVVEAVGAYEATGRVTGLIEPGFLVDRKV